MKIITQPLKYGPLSIGDVPAYHIAEVKIEAGVRYIYKVDGLRWMWFANPNNSAVLTGLCPGTITRIFKTLTLSEE